MMRTRVRCLSSGLQRIVTVFVLALVLAGGNDAHSATASDTGVGDAVRFLEQSSFGATDATIARALELGIPAYLEEQLSLQVSDYAGFSYVPPTATDFCPVGADGKAEPICNRDYYSAYHVQRRFYQNALANPDQLRQRVAWALAQIFVVSAGKVRFAYAMAGYQRFLLDRAFGNFRELLAGITLSPMMGRYLDMVNNDKPDAARGIEPNENYARELMQLFSIGLYELNPDGTVRRDAAGTPVPAYDQDVVEGFAHVFTGWTYPPRPGVATVRHNPENYEGWMALFPSNHATTSKKLLRGVVLPANQSGDKDLADAIDNVFNHPNVGPFIAKQLIQKLVTSNPSPAYVARVAQAFASSREGVRGDMKAVLRAILLDPEARGDLKPDASYGKLKEPAQFAVGLLRALNGLSDGVYPRSAVAGMGEDAFNAASVFNFYPPDFPLPGSPELLGPEFGIQNTTNGLNREAYVERLVMGAPVAADATVVGATGTMLDLSPLQALAGDPSALVGALELKMIPGGLSAAARTVIVSSVRSVAATDTLGRVRRAAYLIAASPQYQTQR